MMLLLSLLFSFSVYLVMVLFFLVQQSWRLRFFFEIVEKGQAAQLSKATRSRNRGWYNPTGEVYQSFFWFTFVLSSHFLRRRANHAINAVEGHGHVLHTHTSMRASQLHAPILCKNNGTHQLDSSCMYL